MYASASNPEMFILPSKSRMGPTVLPRLKSSHEVSSGDSFDAVRMTGLVEGQSPPAGEYPSGAFGRARI